LFLADASFVAVLGLTRPGGEGLVLISLSPRQGRRRSGGTGQSDYSTRQAAYDIRKLRAKGLLAKPERSRRYHVPPEAARTITALSVLRDQVMSPILAGVRSPRQGRKPSTWTTVDRDYESLRVDMQTLFGHLGITTTDLPAAA
jgi:hypothetical protein